MRRGVDERAREVNLPKTSWTRGGGVAVSTAATLLLLVSCVTPNPHSETRRAHEGDQVPENVRMVIPFSEGGGSDVWGRFLGPHLAERMAEDGSDVRFVPENVPGGEAIIGTNRYVADEGNDGSAIVVTSGTTYFQYLLDRPEVEFDFSEMRPLLLNASGGVLYGSTEGGVTGLEDLTDPDSELKFGGISVSGLELSTLLIFELLDIDVDTTFGFEGKGPTRLALERGELNLDYQTTSAYLSQVKPLVDEGRAVPLMSLGQLDSEGNVVRDETVPDLPTVAEVYADIHGTDPSGPAWEAYKVFLAAGFSYQKGLWINKDTPDSIARPFYDAARELRADEDFRREGEEVLGGYPVYPGDEVEESIQDVLDIDPDVQRWVLDLLENEYGADISGS